MRCLIKNQIRIKGPTETISKIWNVHFRGHISNLGRTLDFDTIKPIPVELQGLQPAYCIRDNADAFWEFGFNGLWASEKERLLSRPAELETACVRLARLAVQRIQRKAKTGFKDAEAFCLENWGVGSNSTNADLSLCDRDGLKEIVGYFHTEIRHPVQVMEALADLYPDIEFSVSVKDQSGAVLGRGLGAYGFYNIDWVEPPFIEEASGSRSMFRPFFSQQSETVH